MKLFGYLEKTKSQPVDHRPSFVRQVKIYIDETMLKIKKKDSNFKKKAIILLILYMYVTGVLASFLRYLGEIANIGFSNSPKPTLTPWGAVGALFSFKYSLMAILITFLIAASILLGRIRNHIG